MALGTGIEWTDATWNVLAGCTPVSPGCLNCYAATMARRLEAMGRPEYASIPNYTCGGNGTLRIAEVRNGRAVFTGDVRVVENRLTDPLHWRKPRRVFVNSMSDLFHEDVPFAFIDLVFAVMALCPQHQFQVLTKRPERMAEFQSRPWVNMADGRRGLRDSINEAAFKLVGRYAFPTQSHGMLAHPGWPLPNVWLGTSVEDQARADERIPHLLRCPAAVRFLSCEPLLGAVAPRCSRAVLTDGTWADLTTEDIGFFSPHSGWKCKKRCPECLGNGFPVGIDWIIVGGESGPNARPCDVAWIRSIVRQCAEAGVPCFVKQLGARPVETNHGPEMPMRWQPDDGGEAVQRWYRPADRKGADPSEWHEDLRVRQFPEVPQ